MPPHVGFFVLGSGTGDRFDQTDAAGKDKPPFRSFFTRKVNMKRLWLAFGIVMVASFSVLGWVGTCIYQEAPPLPDQVVTTDGKVVIQSGEIGKGQNVWQAMGGMEVGSIWGHGSY